MKAVLFDDVLCRRQGDYRVRGLELVFYENGDEAVQVLLQERPDLVFMDYSMDALHSGAEAIAHIRAEPRLFGLRIVAISSDRESNEHLLRAGADDAVPKTHLRGYLDRLADRLRLNYHIR